MHQSIYSFLDEQENVIFLELPSTPIGEAAGFSIQHQQNEFNGSNKTIKETNQEASPASAKLRQLVISDQKHRETAALEEMQKALNDPQKEEFFKEIQGIDNTNKQLVQDMINKGELKTAEDFHNAALFFQHGDVPEDLKQAFSLSIQAIGLGMEPQRTLVTQAFDRYMIQKQLQEGTPAEEIKQRFGTQTLPNNRGKMFQPPIDGQATQEELQIFGLTKIDPSQPSVDREQTLMKLQEKLESLDSKPDEQPS